MRIRGQRSSTGNGRPVRRTWRFLLTTGLLAAVAGPGVGPATAQVLGEQLVRFDSVVNVAVDGSMNISETIVYDFGSNVRHGIFRLIPDRFELPGEPDHERATPIDQVKVTSPDAPSAAKVSREGRTTRIRIGDPDRTITGRRTYVVTYRLLGAINRFESHDEIYLNITGNSWDTPMAEVNARVVLPRTPLDAACFAGPDNSSLPCAEPPVVDGETITFRTFNLSPREGLTIVVALPPGTIAPAPEPIFVEARNPLRAFRLDGLNLTALVVGAVGIVIQIRWLAHRGRDRRWRGGPIAEAFGPGGGEAAGTETVPWFTADEVPVQFEPPDGIRPGLAGTLVDEVAHHTDVTATIIDLAARGHLIIEDVAPSGLFGKGDWRLIDLGQPDDDLLTYEALLKASLFQDGDLDDQGRTTVLLSDLKNSFSTRLRAVQDALYEETMARGWFASRPDQARNEFAAAGIVVLVLAGIAVFGAVQLQRLGWAAVPVAVAGVVLLASSPRMPRRTPKGRATYVRTLGFVRLITESEAHRDRFAENMGLFSTYLPYAVAFGHTKKWARTFEKLASAQASAGSPVDTWYPPWYLSSRPLALGALAGSLEDFSERSAGIMASTPAGSGSSGFDGGGFSGGGFGGGGGGSW